MTGCGAALATGFRALFPDARTQSLLRVCQAIAGGHFTRARAHVTGLVPSFVSPAYTQLSPCYSPPYKSTTPNAVRAGDASVEATFHLLFPPSPLPYLCASELVE